MFRSVIARFRRWWSRPASRWTALVAGLIALTLLLTGWRLGALPFQPGARYSDAAIAHFPAALHMRRVMYAGRNDTFGLPPGVPEWVPGVDYRPYLPWREMFPVSIPFVDNPLYKVGYPLQWMVFFWPSLVHLPLMSALHIGIAAAGMAWWLRARGVRMEAAAFGALAYALTPRVMGHLGAGHLDIAYAMAWFPLLMGGLEIWIKSGRVSAEHRGGTLIAGAMLVIADVRVALFALVLAGTVCAAWTITRESWWQRGSAPARAMRFVVMILTRPLRWMRIVVLLVSLALMAASLSSPAWGPNEWEPITRAMLTPAEAGIFSLSPAAVLGIVLPARGGGAELLTYFGLPVAILALYALLTRPRVFAGWGIALALAAWYAMGSNSLLWQRLFELLPVLSFVRVPARAWLVIALIAPMIAAHGLSLLLDRLEMDGVLARAREMRNAFIGGAVTFAAATALAFTPAPREIALGLAIISGGLFVVWGVSFARRLPARWVALAVMLILTIDLLWSARASLEWRSSESWLSSEQVELAEALIEENAYHVYSPSYSLEQQTVVVYGLRMFGMIDPLQLGRAAREVAAAGNIEYRSYSVVSPPVDDAVNGDPATANREATPDIERLRARFVTHTVSAYPIIGLEEVEHTMIAGLFLYDLRWVTTGRSFSVFDSGYLFFGSLSEFYSNELVFLFPFVFISSAFFMIAPPSTRR